VRNAERLESASRAHRESVGACSATIRAVPLAQWTSARAPGKWTAAEIAEHLRIAYDPLLSELAGEAGFAMRLPWWKRRLVRWRFLPAILEGRFPKGAPAPKEIRPSGHSATPEEAAGRLTRAADEFLSRIARAETGRARRVRLTHPYFGGLTIPQTLRLLTSHARHHQAQFPGANAT
jgi:hypothetical protein